MLTITRQQSLERWDVITPDLREALFSEINADFVAQTCEAEHISEEKSNEIAGIAGYVLLGFMRPGDLAKELIDALGLDQKTATSIASSINQRIFTPLKEQIDQVYSPVAPQIPTPSTPKIIQEVKSPSAPLAAQKPPTPPPGPQIISQSYTASPNLGTANLSSNKNVPAQAPKPAAPRSLNDPGWSRQTPQGPTVRLGAINPQTSSTGANVNNPIKPIIQGSTPQVVMDGQSTSPPSPVQSSAQKPPAQQPVRSVSEFDRLDTYKQPGGTAPQYASPVPPPPVSKPQEPAPMILHQQIGSQSQLSSDFQIKAQGKDQIMSTPRPVAPPANRPVVLEFGGDAPQKNPKPVHYTEYIPPKPSNNNAQGIPSAPPRPAFLNDSSRTAVDVMAPPPRPATPPPPPAPQAKVIVKDFL